MENEKINLFKKEFLDEINSQKVSVDDLKKNKISNSVLSAEITLRKVFGDEIYAEKREENSISGEKNIVKLSEEDIAFDSGVREICENLTDQQFDSNVMYLLSKIAGKGE